MDSDGSALQPQTPPKQPFSTGPFTHPPHTVFKQPHPPHALQSSPVYEASHPQLMPGTSRPTGESFPPQQPQHTISGPPEQCGAQPSPDGFVHQSAVRPGTSPGGTPRPCPPGPDSGHYVRSTFGSPFPGHGPMSPRFVDPFHGGHPVRSLGDHFGPASEHYAIVSSGSSPMAQPIEGGFPVHYGSEHYIRGLPPRGAYPVNVDMYMRMPMNPRLATSDPYTRARMPPSPSDAHVRPPMAPRSVISDHYMPCMPLPPRPLSNEAFPRSATPAAPTDPYARPPLTPHPPAPDLYAHSPASSDSFPRQPTTPLSEPRSHPSLAASPSDPYVRTPMTPRPSSEPYSRPPSSELVPPPPVSAVDVQRAPGREPSVESLSSPVVS